MRARIKGYYEIASFELAPVKDTGKRGCKYLRFVSTENVNILFKFYKDEMQQGLKPKGCNLGRSRIAETGFFELGYEHWNEFKKYIPHILYRVTLVDDQLIELSPVKGNQDEISEDFVLNV